MFKDKMKAIEMCVSRFDTETKATFLDLYTKVDAEAIATPEDDIPTPTDEDEIVSEFDEFADPDNTEEAF